MADREKTQRRDAQEEGRRYTLSIHEDLRNRSFDQEDERWSRLNQIRDWMLLLIGIVVWISIQLSLMFFVGALK